MRIEERLLGVVVQAPSGLVVVHADFFDDDFFLHVEIVAAQAGAEDVGQDVDGLRQIFGQHRAVEDGVFFRRERVVIGPDGVKVAINFKCGTARRPP